MQNLRLTKFTNSIRISEKCLNKFRKVESFRRLGYYLNAVKIFVVRSK